MPKTDKSTYISPGARVIGDVTIGADSGVWYNAVIRGDLESITIGSRTSIQDNAVLHTDLNYPLTIGNNVTIGHGAIVHGCTIGDNVIIGMGAIIMNGAVIGSNCIIGAGTLVTSGKKIPDGYVSYGNPCRIVHHTSEKDVAGIAANAEHYVEQARKAADNTNIQSE